MSIMRLEEAMLELNNTVLCEFAGKGLTINEGVAVDARLVKSASKPLRKVDVAKLQEKRETPEGKLDKNGNP